MVFIRQLLFFNTQKKSSYHTWYLSHNFHTSPESLQYFISVPGIVTKNLACALQNKFFKFIAIEIIENLPKFLKDFYGKYLTEKHLSKSDTISKFPFFHFI